MSDSKVKTPLPELRHTAAHVLAYAVQDLFPEAKPTIGPAIENGFYYDFDRPDPFTPDDLGRIESADGRDRRGRLSYDRASGQPRPTRSAFSRTTPIR